MDGTERAWPFDMQVRRDHDRCGDRRQRFLSLNESIPGADWSEQNAVPHERTRERVE